MSGAIVTELVPARAAPVVMVIALLGASCQIDADYSDGSFLCTDECPDNMTCVSGRCVADAPVDGGDGDSNAACVCETARSADDCGANVVDLATAGAPGGQLTCGSTENNTNAVLGCAGNPMPGLDAAFRVAASAGQTLTATVRPTGFDASVYITRDCSGTCDAIADDVGLSGTETTMVTPTVAGDYFVIVDSPTSMGCYELTATLQ